MRLLTLVVYAAGALASAQQINPFTGDELVATVAENCLDMDCVKQSVLTYLDNVLKIKSDTARNAKNIDAAIFKRVARVFKTHEIRYKLPEMLFGGSELVYNPKSGLDIAGTSTEGRGLLLKKKLLLPVLLLLKLKMKALLPIFVALIGLKAFKALILSKLAIAIVIGFVAYQLFAKSGMPMPMMMAQPPPEPPAPAYGAPAPSTAPPSSYEPSWEPSGSGPYSRVWSANSDPQSIAYSAYYPGSSVSASSTTSRP